MSRPAPIVNCCTARHSFNGTVLSDYAIATNWLLRPPSVDPPRLEDIARARGVEPFISFRAGLEWMRRTAADKASSTCIVA
jgi:hypothetical protein